VSEATGIDTRALLRAPEAARFLAVDTRTVWRWASAGLIPAPLRIGGATRAGLSIPQELPEDMRGLVGPLVATRDEAMEVVEG